MNAGAWEKSALLLGVIFFSRAWAKWRGAKRQRADLTTPLVDGAILEAAFTPRPREGDDADLLAEMRDTFAHLNRRAYAEEFWGLHAQLVALYERLGEPQRATMRRALIRLLTSSDRWLQLVAARAAAELKMSEAVPPLRALLELGDSQTFSVDKTEYSRSQAADLRYRQALEEALAALTQPR